MTVMLMCIALLTGATSSPANAQSPDDRYFDKKKLKLTPREKTGLDLQNNWRGSSTSETDFPATGNAGIIRYQYGTSQPSIICAVLQVCDVELQPGEKVQSLHLGDSSRWSVEPAVTGIGENQIIHLIIKPTDVGLETSMVVGTDRRTYHMRLRSHRFQYMPRVAFSYPEDDQAKWAALLERETKENAKQREERTIPQTKEYLGDLNFDYRISGEATWKPVRVYNDGVQTVIQMPATMKQKEAPALLVIRKEGGVFTSEETAMVNYSLQGDRYIVDQVFDRAVLIAGVGSSQDRITIERGK